MEISATMVRELREKTGAGMMDCKRALTEAGGDFAKAEEWLRKKGISKAASKGGRVAAEGLLAHVLAPDGRTAVLAEVNCETDFVARNTDFQGLVKDVAEHIARNDLGEVAQLLEQGWIKDAAKKVKDVLAESIAKIGENISIRRAVRYTSDKQGVIGSYIHSTGRQGALVELATASAAAADHPEVAALAKELAMQVVAVKPEYISRENVPAEVLEKEKEIYREELRAANKPEAIWEKILTGKLEKFYSEKNLVDQVWVKDDKKKIKNLLDEVGKKAGGPVVIKRMSRFEVGEGVEKKKEDLAAEVAATLGTAKA